ncbi:MAG: hypothetical protein Q9162_000807 [Coniocarpon cinnabarinum]
MEVHGTKPVDPQEPKRRAPARWYLQLQAVFWRFLMQIGMWLHRLAPPRPYGVRFTRQIPTTLSPTAGNVTLHFYTPKDYKTMKKLGKAESRYPVVINFHGGGFTLGRATDDARWASRVVEQLGAVVASVDYRLAPEFPFPTAIEDGVDAVLYIIRHAEELHLDAQRIALSGFSCGGNMVFTVPIRLMEELDPNFEKTPKDDPATGQETENVIEMQPTLDKVTDSGIESINTSPKQGSESTHLHPTKGGVVTVSRRVTDSASSSTQDARGTISQDAQSVKLPSFKVVSVVSWYPTCDYTLTREQRREMCVRKDMELSPVFTALFDAAYMAPQNLDRANPYLSPGVASEELLKQSLPEYIQLYTCEWDMLRAEALTMRDRLRDMGKKVSHDEIKGVPHGWDKSPNPFKEALGTTEHYRNACKELRKAFQGETETEHHKSLADRLSFSSIAGRLSLTGKILPDGQGSPASQSQEDAEVEPRKSFAERLGMGSIAEKLGRRETVDDAPPLPSGGQGTTEPIEPIEGVETSDFGQSRSRVSLNGNSVTPDARSPPSA